MKSKIMKPWILAVVLIFFIGGISLVIQPIIKIEDNGEFEKVLNKNGLYYLSKDNKNDIGIYQYYNENKTLKTTSEDYFIKFSIIINKLCYSTTKYDIRFLGGLLLIVHGFAAFMLVKVFSSFITSEKGKYIISLMYVFIFGDTSYIAYFNSFYEQGVILPVFLCLVGVILYYIRFKGINSLTLLIYSLCLFMIINLKYNLFIIGILGGIFLMGICFYLKDKKRIIIFVPVAVTLMLFSLICFMEGYRANEKYIKFQSMSNGVIKYSDNKEAALKEFDIYDNFTLLNDESFYENIPSIYPYGNLINERYYNKISLSSIMNFYIFNPNTFIKVFNMSVKSIYNISPKSYGYFNGYYYFKKYLLPKEIIFTFIYFGTYFLFAIKRISKQIKTNNKNKVILESILLLSILISIIQIITNIILYGDSDLISKNFICNISFDLLLIYSISLVFNKVLVKEVESHEQ